MLKNNRNGSKEQAIVLLEKLMEIEQDKYSFSRLLSEFSNGMGFVLNYLNETNEVVFAGDIASKMNVSPARITNNKTIIFYF